MGKRTYKAAAKLRIIFLFSQLYFRILGIGLLTKHSAPVFSLLSKTFNFPARQVPYRVRGH